MRTRSAKPWLAILATLCCLLPSLALAQGKLLRRGNGPDVETLDPHKVRSVSAGNVVRDLFEGLLGEAPDGHLIPGVAASWQVSEDGRFYVFALRPEARWSNGEALTAADFVYAFRRSLSPSTASPSAALLAPIRGAEALMSGNGNAENLGVTALDDQTLQIELERPTPYFLGLLANPVAYPVHRASIERIGAQFTRAGKLVSNGAYVLDEWALQSHVRLRRNARYWNAQAVAIDTVMHLVTEDLNAEFQRFRAGELHITEQVPAQQIAAMPPALKQQLRIADYLGSYYYGFNLTQPPFKDQPGLRKALSLAIDRQVIADKVMGSGEKPAYGWLPPGTEGAPSQRPEWADWSRERRLIEARRLYAAAGYGPRHPLAVQIRYNTHDYHQKIATVIAAMWKQTLGVQATLYNEETKVFLQSRRERRLTQVFRASWVADYADASSFLDLLLSNNPRNDTGYANARYDTLLAQAEHTSGASRAELLAQAERLMLDDTPVIPIYFYVTKHLVAPSVRGWQDNALDHHYTRDLDLVQSQ